MTFQWTLFTKGQMYNAECPVKYHTHSTKSTTFFKYPYHLTGHHALKHKSVMYGVHQMVIFTQTKPVVPILLNSRVRKFFLVIAKITRFMQHINFYILGKYRLISLRYKKSFQNAFFFSRTPLIFLHSVSASSSPLLRLVWKPDTPAFQYIW